MATAKKKTNDVPAPKKPAEVPAARVAARPQAERRIEAPAPRAAVRQPSSDEISRRAFELWDRSGRQHGHDLENWLQAEAELRGA